jgi:isopentenyldiphosphate isomerase
LTEELVDVYAPDGSKTGEILTKEQAIKEGKLIKAFQIWILNNKNEVLMQLRSAEKIHDAGMIDFCGGHVQSQEREIDAVVREMKEELGENVFSPDELKRIQKVGNGRVDFTEYGRQGNYIIPWYVLRIQRSIDYEDFDLQKEEIAKVKWIPYQDVKNAIISGKKNIRIPNTQTVVNLISKLEEKMYEEERE